MELGSLIRATNLWGYTDLMRELGADPLPFLRRFDIPPGIEHQEDAFMSLAGFVRMLEASAAELDCPDFGLRLARWQGRYELSMANAARMIRLLGGPQARARVFSFRHAQLGTDAAYREALGCTVRFGRTWCGFEVDHRLAGRPIDHADPETKRIATKYLESQYLPSDATLSERVVGLARRLLPTGQCSAEAIADQLDMHPRTLQRRLAAEGLRCHDLIERERRAQAARYLAQPGLYLSQIAVLLGYSEQSARNRSCRRWFGMTPRQYRAYGGVSGR